MPRPNRVDLLVVSVLTGALAGLLLRSPPGDYGHAVGKAGDTERVNDAAPAIDALLAGDLDRLAATQPLMGLASLLLRAPFAAIGRELDGLDGEYRFGALACALVLAGVTAWILKILREHGRSLRARAGVAAVLLVNPFVVLAAEAGHAEDILATALALGAVAAAARRGPLAAGLLIGAAIGTKPWAVVGLVPVLLLAARPARMLAAAAATAALLVMPLPLADPDAARGANRTVSNEVRVKAESTWWPFADELRRVYSTGPGTTEEAVTYRMPGGLTRGDATLILLLVTLAAGAAAVARVPRALDRAVAVLVVLFLLRGALDPWNLPYYALPATCALAVWEGLTRDRLPVVSILAIPAIAFAFWTGVDDTLANMAYLLTVAALGGMSVAAAVRREDAARAPV